MYADTIISFLIFFGPVIPDHLHERFLDLLRTIQDMAWFVVPNDKQTAVSDECRELMFLSARKERHIWQHLQTQPVFQWNVRSIVAVQKQFDDSRIDGYGDADVKSLNGVDEAVRVVNDIFRAARIRPS